MRTGSLFVSLVSQRVPYGSLTYLSDNFYRAAIPSDIIDGVPTPSTWGMPTAFLDPATCDPITNFVNHSVIISELSRYQRVFSMFMGLDLTFCGDWAGNSYATTDCPGTCSQRLMDPSNFVVRTSAVFHGSFYL